MKRIVLATLAAGLMLACLASPSFAWPRVRRTPLNPFRGPVVHHGQNIQQFRGPQRVFVGFDQFGNPVFVYR